MIGYIYIITIKKEALKKIISCFLLLSALIGYTTEITFGGDDDYFVVTAYYSPLPDQEYYITGNYKDELRLNGKGIAGASGKGVFSGMLAAPAKYSFGTKIYLEGLGIGAVEDRGGAIVPAGQRGYSYDRIDVWMGYGDEGLRRANFWGKRKVKGYVVSKDSAVSIVYQNSPAPNWATINLQKTKSVSQTSLSIFETSLGRGSDANAVKELQKVLSDIGYMEKNLVTGVYGAITTASVTQFQLDNSVIPSPAAYGAGYYGPKTRGKLREVYQKHIDSIQKEQEHEKRFEEYYSESEKQARNTLDHIQSPRYGDISSNVRELQIILKYLGYFNHKDTAIFGDKTKQSIIDYQLSRKIIDNEYDIGAGVYGPHTKSRVFRDIRSNYFNELLSTEIEKDIYINLFQKKTLGTSPIL